MPNVIKDKEIATAVSLAKRPKGVTRIQLATKLNCTVDRATVILNRAYKDKGNRLGLTVCGKLPEKKRPADTGNRAKVYLAI